MEKLRKFVTDKNGENRKKNDHFLCYFNVLSEKYIINFFTLISFLGKAF